MANEFAVRPRIAIDGSPLAVELEVLLERVVVDDHLHSPDMFTVVFRDTQHKVLTDANVKIGSKIKISAPPSAATAPTS